MAAGPCVALAGLAGLLFVGCGTSATTSSNAPDVADVTQAAYVTSQGPGFKMDMTESGDIGGESFSLRASGAFDDHDRRGAMSETVDNGTVSVLFDLPYVYVQSSGNLIKGKPWAKINAEGYEQAIGVSGSLETSSDGPSQGIDLLKAAGQADAVGDETLRGVPTTHYHVLVDLARLSAEVPASQRVGAQKQAELLKRISGETTLPIDVWIDARKRVRRYHVQVPLCYQGERTSETVSVELYDYGTQSIPAPPPSSDTTDLTSQVDSVSSKALQQIHC